MQLTACRQPVEGLAAARGKSGVPGRTRRPPFYTGGKGSASGTQCQLIDTVVRQLDDSDSCKAYMLRIEHWSKELRRNILRDLQSSCSVALQVIGRWILCFSVTMGGVGPVADGPPGWYTQLQSQGGQ